MTIEFDYACIMYHFYQIKTNLIQNEIGSLFLFFVFLNKNSCETITIIL